MYPRRNVWGVTTSQALRRNSNVRGRVRKNISAAGVDGYFFVAYLTHGVFPCVSATHAA